MRIRNWFLGTLVALSIASPGNCVLAQDDASESQGIALTIYNQDFGLVKDIRTLHLKEGMNVVRFTDVAAQIDPTSVSLQSLSAPNSIMVREQNYQYDLLDPTSILMHSIGKTLRFRRIAPSGAVTEFTGVLLNSPQAVIADPNGNTHTRYSGLVVKTDSGVVLNPEGQIEIAELPPGLISKPTLVWQLEANRSGDNKAELAYQTKGLNWKSDYVAILNNDDNKLDVTSWVTLDNKSGATYPSASLKLIAGDVHKVQPPARPMAMAGYSMKAAGMQPAFNEQSFAEYHMYTLKGKTDVRNNETKQLSLFSADQVPAKKLYIFDPSPSRIYWGQQNDGTKVATKIEFENTQKNNLGMPMPKGKVRVYKKDADGALQFIGEDEIDHTPKDEKVRLYIGDAFDLVGEHNLQRTENPSNKIRREYYEVSLRNHKDKPVTITSVEHPWGDWKVISANQPYTRKNEHDLEFTVTVPADGETKLDYVIEFKNP